VVSEPRRVDEEARGGGEKVLKTPGGKLHRIGEEGVVNCCRQ